MRHFDVFVLFCHFDGGVAQRGDVMFAAQRSIFFAPMNTREKITLADDPARLCLHKEGIFYKLYTQDSMRFVENIQGPVAWMEHRGIRAIRFRLSHPGLRRVPCGRRLNPEGGRFFTAPMP